MKTYPVFAALLLTSNLAFAQHAWEDAIKLNEYFDLDTLRFRAEIDNSADVLEVDIIDVVAKYCPNAVFQDSGDAKVNLNTCFEGNPFISLRQYAQGRFSNVLSREGPTASGFGNESGNSGGGSLSGSNLITSLADGLAIFLVRRTKEELNAAFFESLRKRMETEPAYHALFPATYDLLYVIGNEVYNYNAYIETLREGFLSDLKVMPKNVRQFSLDHQFVKNPVYQLVLEDLLSTSQQIFDGESPLEILDFLAKDASLQDDQRWQEIPEPKVRTATQDMAMSLRAVQLFTASLTKEVNTKKVWISPEETSRRMKDLTHVYLYLGLLWQQGKGIRFSNGTDLQGALGKLAKMNQVPLSLRNFVVTLTQTGKQLERSFKDLLVKADTASNLNDEYRKFAGQVFDLLEMTLDFRQQIILPDWKVENGKPIEQRKLELKTQPVDTLESKIFTVLHQLYDLEFNVRQEHFTLAASNLTRLLTELLNPGDFKYKKEFLRHVNFMATVAEARDSREVAAAIELFALPLGSSRMKKQSAWSVSLNAYGGIGFGRENDFNKDVADMLDKKAVLAPSAPLGIDLNHGLKNDAGSLSLYAQLIDVGAVFAYRFGDEVSNIPELKFQNIVAPGAYLIYGFGNNIPVSFGVGAQLGPNLRNIDDVGLVTTTKAWRLGAILSVDIPITHFYTR